MARSKSHHEVGDAAGKLVCASDEIIHEPIVSRGRMKCEKPNAATAVDMHMHACMHDGLMRTTIEISDETLRKLRELAARRGEKGYSRIIEEALGAYFGATSPEPGDNRTREERILALEGSISEEEAEEWKAKIRESRRRWRTP